MKDAYKMFTTNFQGVVLVMVCCLVWPPSIVWAKKYAPDHVQRLVAQAASKENFSKELAMLKVSPKQHEQDLANILLSSKHEWKQQWFAAVVLGQRKTKLAVDTLIKATRARPAIVRQAGVHGLSYVDDHASLEVIRGALEDSEMSVRSEAVDAIIRRKDKGSARHLKSALMDKRNTYKGGRFWMRPHIVFAFGALGNPDDVSTLIYTLQDKDHDVAMESCRSLRRMSLSNGWELPSAQRPCKEAWLGWYEGFQTNIAKRF